MNALKDFASEVGPEGPVTVAGGRTQWDVGGTADPAGREVQAPRGVVAHQPEEMIVRVRAGSTVEELDAVLTEGGQMCPLDPTDPGRATIGGVLAVGRTGIRRLRWGPVRDLLLEATFVTAEGELARAGGAVVKNVSGFDLCRLLVGSLGTLGFLAEVVLRTYPRPPLARWLRADGPPGRVRDRVFRPSSILWDGRATWVLLEGHRTDVEAEAMSLGGGFRPAEAPPELPGGARLSLRPRHLLDLASQLEEGTFVAEVDVGVLHLGEASLRSPALGFGAAPSPTNLASRLKERFDPTGRLNPGRFVG